MPTGSKTLNRAHARDFEKQMMRHMFSVFLLWYISKRRTHGYELIKKLEAEEGYRALTASQIYPMLKEMTHKGLIAQQREMQGKRAKKVYHITEAGRESLAEAKRHMVKKPLRRQFLKEMIS
jgi:DNA-binding PadR family transcriptional regulator